MEVILLAAGSGTRMGALTSDRPKALVEVAGEPILLQTIGTIRALLPEAGILIVTGHEAAQVDQRLAGWPGVHTVLNPDFRRDGPLRSIDRALEAVDDADALMIGNGDTIFSQPAIAALLAAPAPVALLGSAAEEGDDDDVQIERHPGEGTVLRAAKRLAPVGALPVSAGLLRIADRAVIAMLRPIVVALLAEERALGRQLTWHSLVGELAARGAPASPCFVPRNLWWEFDSAESISRYDQARGAPGL